MCVCRPRSWGRSANSLQGAKTRDIVVAAIAQYTCRVLYGTILLSVCVTTTTVDVGDCSRRGSIRNKALAWWGTFLLKLLGQLELRDAGLGVAVELDAVAEVARDEPGLGLGLG